MLPETLICLLNAAIVLAQSRRTLSINAVASFQSPNPASFTLPSASQLTVSVALCSGNIGSSPARFFVTNSSTVDDPGPNGGPNVYEIALNDGYGDWTGLFPNGGVLAAQDAGSIPFEVGVSDSSDPIHEVLDAIPLLGDSTANQVLLFSAPFASISQPEPTYPNYTLPAANLSLPEEPSSSPNFTLIISPTNSATPLTSMQQTGCMLAAQNSSGTIADERLWPRDEQGWRKQWIMGGLNPATNYTVYIVQNSTKVSGPIYFSTKSATFSCPLVASLSYCPNIGYAIPLPAPPSLHAFYDASTIPSQITEPLLSYMTNFTTMLTTFACGRDKYSPIVTCADCQNEYRKWLCAVSFTRCSEASPTNPDGFTSSQASPGATGLSAARPKDNSGQQQEVLSALVPQMTSSAKRNPNFPTINTGYTMLLPCLETCTAVDRACPSFLGFRCPVMRFNAAASYGVGYVDSGVDGVQGFGVTGTIQDRWGNIWCNG